MVRTSLVVTLLAAGSLAADAPPRSDGRWAQALEAALDRSADPCVDFYQFACGGWNKANPVPPEESRYARFTELANANRELLRQILDEAAADRTGRAGVARQVGDLHASCLDEAAGEAAGLEPIQGELDAILALASKDQLPALLARLQRAGANPLFGFGPMQDYRDATRTMAALDQGGLGLPDRDHYLKDDARSTELRARYRAHVKNMLALAGATTEAAEAAAGTVLDIETALARISLDRVSRRDPLKRYNRRTLDELQKLVPSFAWKPYLAAAGAPAFDSLNLVSLPFLEGLEGVLAAHGVPEWKAYLRWHALHAAAPWLPARFASEDFDFYGRALTGAREQKPRPRRCVELVDRSLPEALGQLYVERAFAGPARQRTLDLVDGIARAFRKDVAEIGWMSEATKKKAIEKLEAVSNKIGYPDTFRDYSKVRIDRAGLLGNLGRLEAFEWERQMAKIGHPADRREWTMSPPTVNAYYQPLNNSINFPAGILQPPFFDAQGDDAVNYGAIGAVIGHELTHGFDDSGRKFAGDGNLTDWWTASDAAEFEKRSACLVEQYGSYSAIDDVKLDGKLTLGENVADNGGVRLAYLALQEALRGQPGQKLGGFTPEQRFFLGQAQVWCNTITPEAARLRAQTDPHSPGRHRANGVAANLPEFAKAFGCRPGQPMVRENACRVW